MDKKELNEMLIDACKRLKSVQADVLFIRRHIDMVAEPEVIDPATLDGFINPDGVKYGDIILMIKKQYKCGYNKAVRILKKLQVDCVLGKKANLRSPHSLYFYLKK